MGGRPESAGNRRKTPNRGSSVQMYVVSGRKNL